MKYNGDDLLKITEKYLGLKKLLDGAERRYELAWANVFVSDRIQGFGNAETRKAECIKIMELENHDVLDLLQELRGNTKKYWLIREAMITMMKGETV